MALNPVQTIAYFSASESGTSSATAGSPADPFTIAGDSTSASTVGTQWTVNTTGTALSVNVIGSQKLVLPGSATTLDLTGLVTLLATKTFAKVRGYIIKNTATAESGFNLTVGAGSSNGWTPFLGGTTPTLVIPPQGTVLFLNPQIAAWVVDSTHKTLKFDPGANTLTALFGVIGE